MSGPAVDLHPRPEPRDDHDDIVILRGTTWADYQRMLEIRGEKANPRFTFLEGQLEIISPSRAHESIKSMLGRLVEAWCIERGVEITPYGAWTLEDKSVERGVEPDECYVVGDDAEPARPDLAIEVVWTRGGLNKLDVYRRLGVREVWIWRKGAIELFALRGERYEAIPASEVLVGIGHADLVRFVDRRPMTRALREYQRFLRGEPTEG